MFFMLEVKNLKRMSQPNNFSFQKGSGEEQRLPKLSTFMEEASSGGVSGW